MKKILLICLGVIALILVAIISYVATRPALGYSALSECEDFTKQFVKSPSSYRLLNAVVYIKEAKNYTDPSNEMAPYIKHSTKSEIQKIAYNDGSMDFYHVSVHLKFESKNLKGVDVASYASCSYGVEKGSSYTSSKILSITLNNEKAKNPNIFETEPNDTALAFALRNDISDDFLYKFKSFNYLLSDIKIQ